ncbi:hypothetical protein ACFQ7F_39530 [Streptomyces sp. NPDC056486]|uniref:hypothetical protein n=1 Tax=Streptomyces sp. NPDC056486 TaxID=3345835 RepID=UPI003686058C
MLALLVPVLVVVIAARRHGFPARREGEAGSDAFAAPEPTVEAPEFTSASPRP